MSQRRALSKRINSPPPNRYIFNRNYSTQNKIQCQTHIYLQVRSGSKRNRGHLIPHPICPTQERGPRISGRFPSTSGRSPLITLYWVYNPIKTLVIIQPVWRSPIFNHRLHRRILVAVSIIQNGINPVFPNNSCIL